MRSGYSESAMALPSRRNSGLLATPKRMRFPNTFAHQRLHQVAAAHRNRGFVHHHAELPIVHGRPDAARGRLQVAEIGFTGFERRCPHGNENYVALRGRRGQFSAEIYTAARGRQPQ